MMQLAPSVAEDAFDEAALTSAIEEVIAEHHGDLRAAIRGLLVKNAFLEAARDKALDWVSRGYVRGALRDEL